MLEPLTAHFLELHPDRTKRGPPQGFTACLSEAHIRLAARKYSTVEARKSEYDRPPDPAPGPYSNFWGSTVVKLFRSERGLPSLALVAWVAWAFNVCVCVCVRVYIYKYTYANMYVYTHVHTQLFSMRIYICIYTYTHRRVA